MKLIVVISLTFSLTNAHLTFGKQLNPVHGLFVKPSEDGVTGDLYVAASEDDGATSQWLTGLPINFLPKTSSGQTQAASMPVTYTTSLTSSSSPHEETVTSQKRAVVTSSPVKYTYAVPAPEAESGPAHPYPYSLYTPNAESSEEGTQCRPEGLTATTSALPAYPYPYYYPHMLTALSAAMHALKEDGEDHPKSSCSQPHGWPAAYTYPYQYIMVDPTAWSHSSTTKTGKVTTAKESE